MSKFKIFSIALLASAAVSQAQNLDQATKAIDAEQYEKAKSLLKSLVSTKIQQEDKKNGVKILVESKTRE